MDAITPGTHPTLYLSGPMTGLPEMGYPAFHEAAARLRQRGFAVISPAENFGGDTTRPYSECMRLDIRQVTEVDAVAVLPGWHRSSGVLMETTVAGFLGLPVVAHDTLLPVSRGDAHAPATAQVQAASRPYAKVAFAGYARSGKDEAAKVLLEMGYERFAFGDIIKVRLQRAGMEELVTVLDWVRDNEAIQGKLTGTLYSCVRGFLHVYMGDIRACTEDDGAKATIRTILERYGEAFYDDILAEFMATLPEKCVNTRLVRCKEAEEWTAAGGIIVAVIRRSAEPASDWERDRLQELRDAGFIHDTLSNDGTIEELHTKVRRVVRGYLPRRQERS